MIFLFFTLVYFNCRTLRSIFTALYYCFYSKGSKYFFPRCWQVQYTEQKMTIISTLLFYDDVKGLFASQWSKRGSKTVLHFNYSQLRNKMLFYLGVSQTL